MPERSFSPLDAAAMQRALAAHPDDLAGVALRLAWRAGLRRGELRALRWEQVDLAARRLCLDGRDVPLDGETAEALRRWRRRSDAAAEFVLASPRKGTPPTPSTLSNAAARALRGAGLDGVRLDDLRRDFVRRMRAEHGDAYAMRVSGMRLRSYAAMLGVPQGEIDASRADADAGGDRLWELLQQNTAGAAGVALWLSRQAGMTGREIAALTWDDVDLERGVIGSGKRTRYLLKEVIAILRREKESRAPTDDPHVILSASGAPVSAAALSLMLRDLFAKNGMGGGAGEPRRGGDVRRDMERLLRLAEENGFLTVADATRALGGGRSAAYTRLNRLVDAGALIRTGGVYVPKDAYIPPERRAEAVLARVERDGHITVPDAARLLHIPIADARALLMELTARGALSAGYGPGGRRKAEQSD